MWRCSGSLPSIFGGQLWPFDLDSQVSQHLHSVRTTIADTDSAAISSRSPQADRERRRAEARAQREKMMLKMKSKQAAFEGMQEVRHGRFLVVF